MKSKVKIVSRRVVYSGRVFKVQLDTLIEPEGAKVERAVICHRGSVVLVPILDDGRVVLVRQYRHAAGKFLWELVAGTLERGELPLAAAKRELLEETGYRAASFKRVASFFPSPGFLAERMHLFECRGLKAGTPRPESDEAIECRAFSLNVLRKMVRTGGIEDAKTLIGLLRIFRAPAKPR